jgi:malate dehydrogenase (oxaloacetate-decarboxylating)(NADP+)
MTENFTPTKIRREDALEYHSKGRPGKIEVVPTKPTATARDLSLAYTPGVAQPCLEIAKDPDLSYAYTARGNLVAVISNGTAVLGLGDIGPWAGKPVMEGKGVLFKKFADIDVFDLNVDSKDIDHFCTIVKALEPTFGGINLEDIKAPECFVIEERLKREMGIPVFHDDQHGTAIISGAALINALQLVGKRAEDVRVVVSGAGASAIACTKFWMSLGVNPANVTMVDSRGVLHAERTDGVNEWKRPFVRDTAARTLADALDGADVFLGASVAGLLTPDMLQAMAPQPIIFALANPDPEIAYDDAKRGAARRRWWRPAAATSPTRSTTSSASRSSSAGALDVRARQITEPMKLAAAQALAALAREDVPEAVTRAYGGQHFTFGPDYIIPKPFDSRVLLWVAPAVAQAAVDDGVARLPLDPVAYRQRLYRMQSRSNQVMGVVFGKARNAARRIALDDAEHPRVLQAARVLREEGVCEPVLLGSRSAIEGAIVEHKLDDELDGVAIVDPELHPGRSRFAEAFWALRQRRGLTRERAEQLMRRTGHFGCMMVERGEVDGFVTGMRQTYPQAVRPALEIIGTRDGKSAGGVYIVVQRNDFKLLADCTVIPEPSAEQLADLAIATADLARYFDVTPRVAFLSYSNFGARPEPRQSACGGRWSSRRPRARTWRWTERCRSTSHSSRTSGPRTTRSRGSPATPTCSSSRPSTRPTSPTSCCGVSGAPRSSVRFSSR